MPKALPRDVAGKCCFLGPEKGEEEKHGVLGGSKDIAPPLAMCLFLSLCHSKVSDRGGHSDREFVSASAHTGTKGY